MKSRILLPTLAVLALAGYFAWTMMPPKSPANDFNYVEFGKIPVVYKGRVMPIDTLARSFLMIISNRTDFKEFEKDFKSESSEDLGRRKGKVMPATKWYIDAITSAELFLKDGLPAAFKQEVFRIENEDILDIFRLEPRPGWFRYSIQEMQPHLEDFYQQAHRAQEIDSKNRTLKEAKLVELAQHFEILLQLNSFAVPHYVPPAKNENKEDWRTLKESAAAAGQNIEVAAFPTFIEVMKAYAAKDALVFNNSVKRHLTEVRKVLPEVLQPAELESWFNEFAPFYHCAILYGLLLVPICLSWVVATRPLNAMCFWAMLTVALVHTAGLGIRMYIMGRPPVTNLYSSAVYIGWTAVLTCLIVEYFFRNSFALAAGGAIGFQSLIVAHQLGMNGDTMEMMQAVLDTNFWLATHVTTVTFGYTATFLAGFLGVVYIGFGLLRSLHYQINDPQTTVAARILLIFPLICLFVVGTLAALVVLSLASSFLRVLGISALVVLVAVIATLFRRLDRLNDLMAPATGHSIAKAIYGVVCFATMLSFIGTVLGGIWADQSWGRFWGWDPKENGALLIVIWNAIVLHARWGGIVKQRGMAVLAVGGNIITAWSWFGTNMLGVGLHSYGFMAGAFKWLLIFDGFMLGIMALGLLPIAWWTPLPRRTAPAPLRGELAGV